MSIYIFFLVVLFCLAISDLMVGVANDAVNFLNSAIGSQVAKRRIIMLVASAGIITGAMFSNGMMEVARKGLFLPQYFLFTEIILIFLAVMFADILLLDFFNTFGLPTSTTVSLVFGLLGGAVGMAYLKVGDGATIMVDGIEKIAYIGDFINSSQALVIISSILLSVVFSFVFGVVIQWISRLIFTFNVERTIKYYGSLWGGVAISAITFFMLIKGIKHASFMTPEMYGYIQEHTLLIIGGSFVFWALFLQVATCIFSINPLKVVVLAGTFALAMAFAGNDLVNFIGVPLAGYESFNLFAQNGYKDLLMVGLLNDIVTPSYFLIGAGVIMLIVLWFSRKAKTVIETSLNLSRQEEGNERFSSSAFSRLLVRKAVNSGTFFSHVIPQPIIDKITKRFDTTQLEERTKKDPNPPMFDMVRASVNMMVAAILIAVGTSYKLPLSTTYVTFMVAMSTSLVDGAWGRDSAVYRITGVFTVVGGWFITGLAAFSVSLLLSLFLGWAQLFGVIGLVLFVIVSLYRSNITHRKRENNLLETAEEVEETRSMDTLYVKCNKAIIKTLNTVNDLYRETIEQLIQENHKELKKQLKISTQMEEKLLNKRNKLYQAIPTLPVTDSVEATHYYVLTLDYLKELAHCTTFLVDPVYNHVDNNHKPLIPSQAEELKQLTVSLEQFMKLAISSIEDNSQEKMDIIYAEHVKVNTIIKELRKNLIKTIKRKEIGSKTSMLYLAILSETRNIFIYTVNMMRIQNDFTATVKEEK